MMKPLNLLLLFFSVYCSSLFAAGPWGKSHLDKRKTQALTSINQLIQKDKQSSLYQLLPHKAQDQLRQKMQFSDPNSPSFASMTNKSSILVDILNQFHGVELIDYAALLLDYSDVSVYNGNAVYLYETILRYNRYGSAYAFAQLDKLNLAPDSKQAQSRQKLHQNYGFKLTQSHIETDREKPQVCLSFNQRVRGEPAQDWQSLLKVTPTPQGQWGYHGQKLCFFAAWQTRYHISINPDLQSQYHLKLAEKKEQTINTGMRPPLVRFHTQGNVLAAADKRYLPLESVNIERVSVDLWQIPANNLSNQQIQSIVESPQQVWRLQSLLNREAEKLFSGVFDVADKTPNVMTVTNVFFDDLMPEQATHAGIYVMTANNADSPGDAPTALAFSLSNAGLSAYLTSEGLWAELRQLKNTQVLAGEKLTLYAKNNRVLGHAHTDDKGVAHFAKPLISGKDGLQPSHIISQSGNYFAYAGLHNPFDLSDKGLSGKIENAPLHSWIWADRGIYRPNDTANIMWLLKTPQGEAFNQAPVWLQLLRPDGQVMHESLINANAGGAYQFSHYFSNTARQGSWRLRLSLGKDGALLADKPIQVASIVPQQITVNIVPPNRALQADTELPLTVQADWLYGTPAADLKANIRQSVQMAKREDSPWEDWQWGLHDEQVINEQLDEDLKTTNKDGSATFALNLGTLPLSTQPLQLKIKALVDEPSGQQVAAVHHLPIQRKNPYLALKAVQDNQVDLALLDDNNQLVSANVQWQLYRLNYDYYWYYDDGRWQYQDNTTRQLFESGRVALNGSKPTRLKLPLDDGAWVLLVRGDAANVAASIPLHHGQYAAPNKDNAPNRIQISSNQPRYADGETVKLHLQAPFDGKASVKLAYDNQLIDNHFIEFNQGEASLTLTWDKKWDKGLWLLANAWNRDTQNPHSRRAVGLHWLGGDLSPHRIDVSLDLPQTTLPNTTLALPISVPTSQLDSSTWVQVAVVDDGLYRLAKPSFYSPLKRFFDKQQLNIQFFDVWGRLIEQVDGHQAALRSGAGADESGELGGLKALPELDLQLLTFWSKPTRIDASGKALIKVDLPQFNGRLRVMTAVWNANRLGADEQTLTVKAPLVGNLYTPPYLSPGDSSQIRLRLHNTSDDAMTVKANLTADGVDFAQQTDSEIRLSPDQSIWLNRDFNVGEKADKRIHFNATIRGQQSIDLHRFADVRPRAYPLKSQSLNVIDSGKLLELPALEQGQLLQRRLFISTQAPFDPENLLQQLSVYPYGCSEQIASKAGSHLLLADLSPRYALSDKLHQHDDEREKLLFSVQNQLANHQATDGGFSLWGNSGSNIWLSAYIGEFYLNAQKANQLTDTLPLERVLAYLRQAVLSDWGGSTSQAYAYYVLAKSGAPLQGATLRFAENLLIQENLPKLSTPTLRAVSALVMQGEIALAERLMNTLIQQGIDHQVYDRYQHYGDSLRNYAQSLVLLYDLQKQLHALGVKNRLKTDSEQAINLLWQPLRQSLSQRFYYSTQESYWLAALAAKLPQIQDKAIIHVDGKPIDIDKNKLLVLNKNQPTRLENHSASPLYLTQSDWVIPKQDSQQENGYRLAIRYEDNQGQAVDLNKLTPNQTFFAVVTVSKQRQHRADLLFVYPLPAGIKTVEINQQFDDKEDRPWFGQLLTPTFTENRDDRYIAAFNVGSHVSSNAGSDTKEETTFTHVFMLRAARSGTWHAPAYSIEEMYQPQARALYPSPTVTVE